MSVLWIEFETEITSEIFSVENYLHIFNKLRHLVSWLDEKYLKVP